MLLCQQYAQVLEPGEILTRREIAERVGRSKTTTFIAHLERAVSEGLLHKGWFQLGNSPGWGYGLPETMQKLPGMEQ